MTRSDFGLCRKGHPLERYGNQGRSRCRVCRNLRDHGKVEKPEPTFELGTFAATAVKGDKFLSPDGKVHTLLGEGEDGAVDVLVQGQDSTSKKEERMSWSPRILVRPVPQGYRRRPGGRLNGDANRERARKVQA